MISQVCPLFVFAHWKRNADISIDARAVFETTVGKLTSDSTTVVKAKPIFLFLHEYESHFGELSQVARLEKRMRELYPEDLELRHFAQRYVSSGFDPTTVRPIVSPQQVKTKTLIHRSVEGDTSAVDSPPMKLSETAATNSPKRPLPTEDFEDTQPRKVARGESPLKGAAGRRMDQQKRQNLNGHAPSSLSQVHLPPPPPLPGHIAFLLSIIPKASTYVDARFDPIKMVELLRDVRLPPTAFRAPEATPSWHQHQQPPPPHFHPQAQSVMHSGMMPSGHGMGQPQYGGKQHLFFSDSRPSSLPLCSRPCKAMPSRLARWARADLQGAAPFRYA